MIRSERFSKTPSLSACGVDAEAYDDVRADDDVATLEEAEQTARRVFGGVHPLARTIQGDLKRSRATLGARETPPTTKSQN